MEDYIEKQPYIMGLQISSGMDDQVSIPDIWRRGGPLMQRITARDSDQQRDDDLCGLDQS